jgi:predicted transcriptional regulator
MPTTLVHSATSSAIRRILDRLKKTGNTLVLTINGNAELVVQDAAAYQELLDRVETIEDIQRGLADARAGRAMPTRKVSARTLERWDS